MSLGLFFSGMVRAAGRVWQQMAGPGRSPAHTSATTHPYGGHLLGFFSGMVRAVDRVEVGSGWRAQVRAQRGPVGTMTSIKRLHTAIRFPSIIIYICRGSTNGSRYSKEKQIQTLSKVSDPKIHHKRRRFLPLVLVSPRPDGPPVSISESSPRLSSKPNRSSTGSPESLSASES